MTLQEQLTALQTEVARLRAALAEIPKVAGNAKDKIAAAALEPEKPAEALPEISPCPYCNGPVSIDDPEAHERGIGYSIDCDRCYLSMHAWAKEKPESLILRWNTRREPAEKEAQ